MSRQTVLFIWTVIAVGVVVSASAMATWRSENFVVFTTCLVLTAVAATFKVRLPGLEGTISPSFVFILIAVERLGWGQTVALSLVSALVQVLWKPKLRPTLLQVAFNAAALTISGALAHRVGHGLVDGAKDSARPLVLAVAGVVLLVTNATLVAVVLCLVNSMPVQTAWRKIQMWAVPYYLAGGVLAGVWAPTALTSGVRVALLAAISVYLLTASCRGFVEQVTVRRS